LQVLIDLTSVDLFYFSGNDPILDSKDEVGGAFQEPIRTAKYNIEHFVALVCKNVTGNKKHIAELEQGEHHKVERLLLQFN
jgi:hypothetical protein